MSALRFVDQVREVLRAFAGGAALEIHARTLSGISEAREWIAAPFPAVPRPVLQLLADLYSVRVTALTRTNGQELVDLAALAVLWRPSTAIVDGRHAMTEEGRQRIKEALATMPPPSVLVDAGPEVWAAWCLQRPLPAEDAPALLTRAAERLGGVTPGAEPWTLPVAGPVRNWNTTNPDRIDILEADASRRYGVAALEAYLQQESTDDRHDTTPAGTARQPQRGRKAERSIA